MARYKGPKHKLSRREGVNLTGTTSPSLADKLNVPPSRTGRRQRRSGEYEIRLRAKQRVKLQYGLLEKQFRRFFKEASRMPGPTGANLLQLLERRLDNAVYRIGLARTRPMARQLVSHGHVLVNDKKVDIPSFLVKPGDVITLAPVALRMPVVQEEMQTGRRIMPSWLQKGDGGGRVVGYPRREDSDADIREDMIVEFYAR
ncbi:MAG TPA: 30S ribosomal protein S4 [Blastocatellia bacterium]|nr:30S ribosomal protein S4 [Blastocatellia bacterium]